MRRPSRRISRLLGFTVVPVSLVATGLFVTASSYSVFSATTTNPANSWTAGSITLTDDDPGGTTSASAMFNVSNIKPGQSGERCIVVSYTGTNANVASTVKLYGANYVPSTTNDIGTRINLTVDQGTGTGSYSGSSAGTAGSCSTFTATAAPAVYSGTLAGFSSNTSWANTTATNPWTTTSTTESRIYRFKWTMADGGTSVDNLYQGKQAKIDFVWEAQTS